MNETIIRGHIAGAYMDLAADECSFVSIAEIKARIPVPETEVNKTLVNMYKEQVINLIPRNSPRLLTEADRKQVTVRCGGQDKHLMAWVTR